jgi:hypothetical protein
MHTFDPLCVSSDLPDVNPATLNGVILYYRLMTKWSGLGDSTELPRMGLSQLAGAVSYQVLVTRNQYPIPASKGRLRSLANLFLYYSA